MSQEHYFSATPAVELTKHVHTLNIRGTEHQVTTLREFLVGASVDLGTQVLLSHVLILRRVWLGYGLWLGADHFGAV